MKRIAVTGASGLIGSRMIEMLGYKYIFIQIPQPEVDITQAPSIVNFLKGKDFEYLIHLAAFTNVDLAEKQKKLCEEVNVLGTKNIFDICLSRKAKLINISTDFVFDGHLINGKIPTFDENSPPNPLSFYGKTKMDAERIITGQAMNVRTTYPYRKMFEQKNDFVATVRKILLEGKPVVMVQDALITPTFIDDFVVGLDYLIDNYSPEIYHLVGSESLSPYDAGIQIAKNFGLDKSLINPTTYAEYFRSKALRPQYAKTISTKNIGVKMKNFETGLREIIN
jgi:dTDP-4-dehydrorhamnose reductase